MSDLSVNSILDASGGATTTINGFTPTVSNMAGRNRIINGDMRIDQRNAGASVTPTNAQYTIDRWSFGVSQASKFTAQRSTVAPTGFSNSLLVTSSSAYSITSTDVFWVDQRIEGFNVADLGWGTAAAQTITLSFWVRSSLTGTFGGAVINSALNRAYPFSYAINAANTWEQKSITISGDTTGTWLTDNSIGLWLMLGIGMGSTYSGTAGAWAAADYRSATGATSVVGTSGATFYITGVQLEAGSVATPFEHRQYGQELALCQRYYEFSTNAGSLIFNANYSGVSFIVTKRATPTITITPVSGTTSGISTDISGLYATNTTLSSAAWTATSEL